MNIYNTIVYSGNYETPPYLSELSDKCLDIKSNEISRKFINKEIQSSDIFIIEDLLSFPEEWIKAKTLNPIIILNIDERLFPEASKIYMNFIYKFITPYDFIILTSSFSDSQDFSFQSIQACSANIISKSEVPLIINSKLYYPLTKFTQFSQLSIKENKLAYFAHEKVFLNSFNNIIRPQLKNHGSVIEFSSRENSFYEKFLKQERWLFEFYKVDINFDFMTKNQAIDFKNNFGILAFEYNRNSEEFYFSMIKFIAQNLISGGYFIILEDLLLPDSSKQGLSITHFEEKLVQASNAQLSLEHFELFQYKNISSEITSICYLLRKLGTNQ